MTKLFNRTQTASIRGFTLIEVLLAMTLLTVVMGSLFSTITVSMNAYQDGQRSMEIYQSARIALQKISDEMRLSLSPLAFWEPNDRGVMMDPNQLMEMNQMLVQEDDPGEITFMGKKDRVLYVRKVYYLDQYPPFDLEECEIYVDKNTQRLTLKVLRSLLKVKQAAWFYAIEFGLEMKDLNGVFLSQGGKKQRFRQMQEMGGPLMTDYVNQTVNNGWIGRTYTLAEGIKSVEFRYADDDGWKSSWDSQSIEIQYRRINTSPNFNASQDTIMEEKGPPLVVEIKLVLENNDMISTTADIPAGNLRSRNAEGKGGFQVGGGGAPPPDRLADKDKKPNQNVGKFPSAGLPVQETPVAVPGR